MKQKSFLSIIRFTAVLLLASPPLFAQDSSYDKYAPLQSEPKQATLFERSLLHFPEYPFEILRYPVDKSLVYMEKHHVMEKIQWVYDTLGKKGLTPKLNLISLARLDIGAEVDFVRALHQKERFPDLVADSWIHFASHYNFNVGSRLGVERIGGTGFRTQGYFQYETHPQEHFYGIGPHSSRGDGYVYKREETNLQYLLGYKPDVAHSLDFKFGYRNVHIADGRDGSMGRYNSGIFNGSAGIPGLHGDELLVYKTEAKRDTRDQAGNSTTGGLQKFGFSYNQGLYSSNAEFFKYEMELSHYFKLGTPRRVLGIRAYGEHNSETNGHSVPFHQMARLGGYGMSDQMSETLRAYRYNRFTDRSMVVFNVEYRYNLWEYRDWKTDAVVFLDSGQVFKNFDKLKSKNLRESYGVGIRTSLANVVLLSLEMAHGDEGTNYYVKTSTPF
ncbi:MAG: hypothetical protein EXS63_02470 [Candidatus Omnitrophica bacterium]|nr:hypothetical protein [Candidatus Omnitrophota bacterium]